MEELDKRLSELTGLTQLLSREIGITLEVDERYWAFDVANRVLKVKRHDLINESGQHCAGLIAHEVGHFFISRYVRFKQFSELTPLQSDLLNAIEDFRSDSWMMERFPGTIAWMNQVYQYGRTVSDDHLGPLSLEFNHQCAREPERNWDTDLEVPAVVQRALDETRLYRQQYIQLRPAAPILSSADAHLRCKEYADVVFPEVAANEIGSPINADEAVVQSYAWDAFKLARECIFPISDHLWNMDCYLLAKALTNDWRLKTLADRLQTPVRRQTEYAQILQIVIAYQFSDIPDRPWSEPGGAALRLATEILNSFLQQEVSAPGLPLTRTPKVEDKKTPFGSPKSRDQFARAPKQHSYGSIARKAANQIRYLSTNLEKILYPKGSKTRRSGYRSGSLLNYRKLLLCQQNPARQPDYWERRAVSRGRNVAFALLIDCSGSMSGQKIDAATKAAVIMAEALNDLGIPFCINGFQDKLIPVHAIGQHYGDKSRERLAALNQEVAGKLPGGNNRPEYNDDGPCLQQAADQLLSYANEHHVLISVSDGRPEGSSSGSQDLANTIRSLTKKRDFLTLVGLGIGPRTEHVKDYYPNAETNIPIDEFPVVVAGLIARQVSKVIPLQF